jgi:hypothetical protein
MEYKLINMLQKKNIQIQFLKSIIEKKVTVKKVPEKMSLTKCPWFLVPEMKCPQTFCPLKNVPMIKCPEDEMSFITNIVNTKVTVQSVLSKMSSDEMSFMTNMFGNSPECPFKNVLHFLSFRYIYTPRKDKSWGTFLKGHSSMYSNEYMMF